MIIYAEEIAKKLENQRREERIYVNKRQIAFIICSNNLQYYNECVKYIQELKVPETYEIDIICVQKAESMAQGYNAGMLSSEAKYKVYLHHDTFIMNRNFIYDFLKVFEMNEKVGLMGVLGASQLPDDADLCFKWNRGRIEAYNGLTTIYEDIPKDNPEEYVEVKAVDGLIMITQYDIPWREDLLDGWDFYDVSQCLEMQRHGYMVVIPYQETPWCYHDCGVSKLENYDLYREKIVAEYPEYFSGRVYKQQTEEKQEKLGSIIKIRHGLIRLMELQAYGKVEKILSNLDLERFADTEIREIANLMEIYSLEKDSVSKVQSEWFGYNNWNSIREYYTWIRFVLLRAGYGREDEGIAELYRKIEQGKLSRDAVRKIATAVLKNTESIYQLFWGKIEQEPLVSVILQIDNGEKTVGQTIESILGQTYKNMEIFVVDDASTDRSREMISAYAQTDKRIKTFFLQKKQNICYGGNICAENAKGKYVAIIRQGDVWLKDKLMRQILFLEEHPSYGISFTWADIFGEMKWSTWYRLNKQFFIMNSKSDIWIGELFRGKELFVISSTCARKDVIEKVGFYHYDLVQLHDLHFWLKVLLEAPVYIIQEKLVWYRQMENDIQEQDEQILKRREYELQWIRDDITNRLPPERFKQIFKEDKQFK